MIETLRPEIETLPYPDGTTRKIILNRTLHPGEDIPIYIISMDKDLNRRRSLANHVLSKVHNPATFVRANPRDVHTDEFETMFEIQKAWQLDSRFDDPSYDNTAFPVFVLHKQFETFNHNIMNQFHFRPMKEGEIGLAISHYRIWAHAYHSGLPYVIVLEDDAEFSNFKESASFRIPESLRNVDWDLLYVDEEMLTME